MEVETETIQTFIYSDIIWFQIHDTLKNIYGFFTNMLLWPLQQPTAWSDWDFFKVWQQIFMKSSPNIFLPFGGCFQKCRFLNLMLATLDKIGPHLIPTYGHTVAYLLLVGVIEASNMCVRDCTEINKNKNNFKFFNLALISDKKCYWQFKLQ